MTEASSDGVLTRRQKRSQRAVERGYVTAAPKDCKLLAVPISIFGRVKTQRDALLEHQRCVKAAGYSSHWLSSAIQSAAHTRGRSCTRRAHRLNKQAARDRHEWSSDVESSNASSTSSGTLQASDVSVLCLRDLIEEPVDLFQLHVRFFNIIFGSADGDDCLEKEAWCKDSVSCGLAIDAGPAAASDVGLVEEDGQTMHTEFCLEERDIIDVFLQSLQSDPHNVSKVDTSISIGGSCVDPDFAFSQKMAWADVCSSVGDDSDTSADDDFLHDVPFHPDENLLDSPDGGPASSAFAGASICGGRWELTDGIWTKVASLHVDTVHDEVHDEGFSAVLHGEDVQGENACVISINAAFAYGGVQAASSLGVSSSALAEDSAPLHDNWDSDGDKGPLALSPTSPASSALHDDDLELLMPTDLQETDVSPVCSSAVADASVHFGENEGERPQVGLDDGEDVQGENACVISINAAFAYGGEQAASMLGVSSPALAEDSAQSHDNWGSHGDKVPPALSPTSPASGALHDDDLEHLTPTVLQEADVSPVCSSAVADASVQLGENEGESSQVGPDERGFIFGLLSPSADGILHECISSATLQAFVQMSLRNVYSVAEARAVSTSQVQQVIQWKDLLYRFKDVIDKGEKEREILSRRLEDRQSEFDAWTAGFAARYSEELSALKNAHQRELEECVETRVAWDLQLYSYAEFLDWYGNDGHRCWCDADPRFLMDYLMQVNGDRNIAEAQSLELQRHNDNLKILNEKLGHTIQQLRAAVPPLQDIPNEQVHDDGDSLHGDPNDFDLHGSHDFSKVHKNRSQRFVEHNSIDLGTRYTELDDGQFAAHVNSSVFCSFCHTHMKGFNLFDGQRIYPALHSTLKAQDAL